MSIAIMSIIQLDEMASLSLDKHRPRSTPFSFHTYFRQSIHCFSQWLFSQRVNVNVNVNVKSEFI